MFIKTQVSTLVFDWVCSFFFKFYRDAPDENDVWGMENEIQARKSVSDNKTQINTHVPQIQLLRIYIAGKCDLSWTFVVAFVTLNRSIFMALTTTVHHALA